MSDTEQTTNDVRHEYYFRSLFARHPHLDESKDSIMIHHLAVVYVLLDNSEEACLSGGDRYAPDTFQKLLATALRYEIELGLTPRSRASLVRTEPTKDAPLKELGLERMQAQ